VNKFILLVILCFTAVVLAQEQSVQDLLKALDSDDWLTRKNAADALTDIAKNRPSKLLPFLKQIAERASHLPKEFFTTLMNARYKPLWQRVIGECEKAVPVFVGKDFVMVAVVCKKAKGSRVELRRLDGKKSQVTAAVDLTTLPRQVHFRLVNDRRWLAICSEKKTVLVVCQTGKYLKEFPYPLHGVAGLKDEKLIFKKDDKTLLAATCDARKTLTIKVADTAHHCFASPDLSYLLLLHEFSMREFVIKGSITVCKIKREGDTATVQPFGVVRLRFPSWGAGETVLFTAVDRFAVAGLTLKAFRLENSTLVRLWEVTNPRSPKRILGVVGDRMLLWMSGNRFLTVNLRNGGVVREGRITDTVAKRILCVRTASLGAVIILGDFRECSLFIRRLSPLADGVVAFPPQPHTPGAYPMTAIVSDSLPIGTRLAVCRKMTGKLWKLFLFSIR